MPRQSEAASSSLRAKPLSKSPAYGEPGERPTQSHRLQERPHELEGSVAGGEVEAGNLSDPRKPVRSGLELQVLPASKERVEGRLL
jgi:hypothetical protein